MERLSLASMAEGRILNLCQKYPGAIPVFGGALCAAKALDEKSDDFETVFEYLTGCLENAVFFRWHEPKEDTVRRFFALVGIDPALIAGWEAF